MENLCSLSDDDLFRQLHELVATQRGCIAKLIVHLAEADARRAHLDKGFSSLFVYCVERLHFSEDEACRRIDAARLSRRYPEVIELLRSGAVSLTALGIAKVHLTAQNRIELFAGISGKSTRAWVGPDGHRCGSRAFLEFDHTEPEALGGDGHPDRVRLLCRAHNYRAAEAVFGAVHMRRKANRDE